MTASDSTAADRMLHRIGQAMAGLHGVRLEFSLRMREAALVERGRFSAWVPANGGEAVAHLLQELGAPDAVTVAARAKDPINLGLGVTVEDGDAALQLYRHDRLPVTLQDRYRAWRWRGGAVETLGYTFHFLPETADGRDPAAFVAPALRPGSQAF